MMCQSNERVKFSVVLPIYNVEKYLNRCINSVINQTYKNLEIILVDDGSKDGCPKMCDEWALKDNRIKVIHKLNAGLGEARNSGLEIATGDYICFFDSDDYVETNLFEDAYKIICAEQPDLIEFGHYRVDDGGKVTKAFFPRMPKLKYENEEIMHDFLPELICTDPETGKASDLLMSAWSCLYNRKLLKRENFYFVSERELICEDVYSLMVLMPTVKCACIMQGAYYYYCENGQSLTHVYRPDRFEKLVFFQQKLEKLCSGDCYSEQIRYRIQRPFLDNLLSCIKGEVRCINGVGIKKVYRSLLMMCRNDKVQSIIRKFPGNSFSLPRRMIHFCIKRKMVLGVLMMVKFQQFFERLVKQYGS